MHLVDRLSTDAAPSRRIARAEICTEAGGWRHARVGRAQNDRCRDPDRGVIELALTPDWHWTRLLEIPVQLLIRAWRLGSAWCWPPMGRRADPAATIGLYPAVTFAIAFLSFGITTVLGEAVC